VPCGHILLREKTVFLEGPRVQVANTVPYGRLMGTLRGVSDPYDLPYDPEKDNWLR
jgi:hypothetical protein